MNVLLFCCFHSQHLLCYCQETDQNQEIVIQFFYHEILPLFCLSPGKKEKVEVYERKLFNHKMYIISRNTSLLNINGKIQLSFLKYFIVFYLDRDAIWIPIFQFWWEITVHNVLNTALKAMHIMYQECRSVLFLGNNHSCSMKELKLCEKIKTPPCTRSNLSLSCDYHTCVVLSL
jgi:hypothetical protein